VSASALPPPAPRRPPTAAGVLYPDDPLGLRTLVRSCLAPPSGDTRAGRGAGGEAASPGRPAVAIITPHAGLRVSGPVAGAVYREVAVPRVAVVLSPWHTAVERRPAIFCTGAIGLPGGDVPVAEEVAESLRDLAVLREDPSPEGVDHGVELQLPFLRERRREVTVVPVLLGAASRPTLDRIGAALADVVTQYGRDVLVVGSADLGRGRDARLVRQGDEATIEAVASLDPGRVGNAVFGQPEQTCAASVLYATVVFARALGATDVRCVARSTTVDVDPQATRVVGYAGLIVR